MYRGFEAEVGILIATFDAVSEVPRNRCVQAAADKRRKRGRLALSTVCRPGLARTTGPPHSLHKNRFSFDTESVLRAAHEEVGMLRRSEVGSKVCGGVDFESQVVPGTEGNRGIEAIQPPVVSSDSIERVRKERIPAEYQYSRRNLLLGVEDR